MANIEEESRPQSKIKRHNRLLSGNQTKVKEVYINRTSHSKNVSHSKSGNIQMIKDSNQNGKISYIMDNA